MERRGREKEINAIHTFTWAVRILIYLGDLRASLLTETQSVSALSEPVLTKPDGHLSMKSRIFYNHLFFSRSAEIPRESS